jgi:maleylpyruvate isomerase
MPDATPSEAVPPQTPEDATAQTEPPTDRVVGPVTAATERFIATVEALDAESLQVPSRCDGWARAHVAAHIARNADALTNLLAWASTDVETPMYPSAEARNADIEAGATREHAELVDDLRTSAGAFSSAVSALPEDRWERQVKIGPAASGPAIPARRIMWVRLRELELHHVDLDAGYGPSDWPAPFVRRALREALQACGRRDEVPPFTAVIDGTREAVGGPSDTTVHGDPALMLAWLTGRDSGDDLTVEPPGALPVLPPGSWL